MFTQTQNNSFEPYSAALPTGYTLRDYTIEKVLGQGVFGITYLARENSSNYPVVIKENYPSDFAYRDPTTGELRPMLKCEESYRWALESFEKEACTLRKLPKHPNLVHITNVFRALNTTYFVMEKIDGRNLAELYPINSQMEPQLLENILRKLLSALDFLHKQGLLHRDIKPGNIILTPEGEPVLIDSIALCSMEDIHDAVLIGTPGFSPPEQLTTRSKLGPWTDLYALGATCYYLIDGEAPPLYYDRMPDETYIPLATRPELQGRFSRELLATIDKALALHTADRWQSAQEWMDALSAADSLHGFSPSPALPAGYTLRDYTIEKVLGQGEFGITYLARENMTNYPVVIKENYLPSLAYRDPISGELFPKHNCEDSFHWTLQSFEKIATLLRKLPRHNNIVHVTDVFRALNTAYFVMEKIDGINLAELYPINSQMEPQLLENILRKLLSALDFLHKQGHLHRDIKPGNIILTPEGEPVLIDFGASYYMSEIDDVEIIPPGFTPPEHNAISRNLVGPWTDLYALGATCYYLIDGEAPPNCYVRMPDETYIPLATRPELQGRFSRELLATIDKALALHTADRWQSAQEWMDAINPTIYGTRMPTFANR